MSRPDENLLQLVISLNIYISECVYTTIFILLRILIVVAFAGCAAQVRGTGSPISPGRTQTLTCKRNDKKLISVVPFPSIDNYLNQ